RRYRSSMRLPLRAALAGIAVLIAVGTAHGQQPAPGSIPSFGPPPVYPLIPPPRVMQPPAVGGGLMVASAEAPATIDPKENAAANFSQRLADVEKFVKGERDKRAAEEQKKQQLEQEGYEVRSDLNFKTFWRDGLNAETANKDFRVHFGGRLHVDAAWFNPDSNLESLPGPGGWQDGADFRRLRLRGGGTMYEVFIWVLEFDLTS